MTNVVAWLLIAAVAFVLFRMVWRWIFGLLGKKHADIVSFPRNRKAEVSLKRATAFKNAGKLPEAIDELRAFRRHAEKGKVSFPVESYLRLPLYLQSAGRREEAWKEFYRLLEEGYPNQINVEGCIWAERSTVYDKMRLFLQRDEQPRLAFYFGTLSLASSLRGRWLFTEPDLSDLSKLRDVLPEKEYRDAVRSEKKRAADENAELKSCMVASKLAANLTPGAKKAGCLDSLPDLLILLADLTVTKFDFELFSSKAKTLLIPEPEA